LFNVLLFHSVAGVFHPQVFILRNVSGTGTFRLWTQRKLREILMRN